MKEFAEALSQGALRNLVMLTLQSNKIGSDAMTDFAGEKAKM